MVTKITKMQSNLVKWSYSAQKLQFQTILISYKLCVTKKRTYVNKLKLPIKQFCCQYPLINYLGLTSKTKAKGR